MHVQEKLPAMLGIHLRMPIYLTDENRHIFYNNMSEEKEGQEYSVRIEGGILNCKNPYDTVRLQTVVLDAVKKNKENILAIIDQSGSVSEFISVRPYIDKLLKKDDVLALISVQCCNPKSSAYRHRLKSVFAFTDKECSICEGLVVGLDAQEIANDRGVSLSTIRSQLTSIMLKARCRRQVELVSLLSRVAVIT